MLDLGVIFCFVLLLNALSDFKNHLNNEHKVMTELVYVTPF